MRYIIIPLAIILYIWWSYKSIKDLKNKDWEDATDWWVTIHLGTIGSGVGILIIENW